MNAGVAPCFLIPVPRRSECLQSISHPMESDLAAPMPYDIPSITPHRAFSVAININYDFVLGASPPIFGGNKYILTPKL